MHERPDTVFLYPDPAGDGAAWLRRVDDALAAAPPSAGAFVLFGNYTWRHPDPQIRGETPCIRPDGTVGYLHRFAEETAEALRRIRASGRAALAYVYCWDWRRVVEEELGEARPAAGLSMLSFCLELRRDGWGGIYFDGLPPLGWSQNVEGERVWTAEDLAYCALWTRELRRQWRTGEFFAHDSARDAPTAIDALFDRVLYGENSSAAPGSADWERPGLLPARWALRLRQMGVTPYYKPATGASDELKAAAEDWFDVMAALGGIRLRPTNTDYADRLRRLQAIRAAGDPTIGERHDR